MWKVENHNIDLPEGFSLWEDGHFLYLRFGAREVAVFSILALNLRKKIEKEANLYLQSYHLLPYFYY
jgi:hypothetical protein